MLFVDYRGPGVRFTSPLQKPTGVNQLITFPGRPAKIVHRIIDREGRMNSLNRMMVLIFVTGLGLGAGWHFRAHADETPALQLETLMRSELEDVDGTEVIVSLVSVPPAGKLASHYHPGEEFVYVLEGSGTISLKDKPDVHLQAGDVFKVPLDHIHSATSGDAGMKALVFRVHRTGEPERFMIE